MAAYQGLARALALGPDAIVDEVTAPACAAAAAPDFRPGSSGRPSAQAGADQKYIVCNADEGDSGTFADRMIMEGDPFVADRGHDDRRHRGRRDQGLHLHPLGISACDRGHGRAIDIARRARATSAAACCGSGLRFRSGSPRRRRRLCLRRGDRAAGKPGGQARHGPRQAAAAGAQGPVRQADRDQQRAVARLGPLHPGRRRRRLSRSRLSAARAAPCRSSSPAISSMAACSRSPSASPWANWSTISAAAPRPAGRCARCRSAARSAPISRARCSTRPFDYEAFAARDGLIGHGGVVVFDDTVDMARQARFAMEFCAIESCGKCTPCRIGSTRGVEVIDRITRGERRAENLAAAERPLQHHEVRLALRARRLHALPGDERADTFPRRFRRGPPRLHAAE